VGETQFDLQANHRAGKQCFQIAGSQQWDGIALQSYNPAFGVPGGQTNTDFWGLKDFEHTFGHKADGMWLPETAADQETLELLAANGVKFTILAPWQAEGLRDPASPALIKTSNGNLAGFFYQRKSVQRSVLIRKPQRMLTLLPGMWSCPCSRTSKRIN